MKCLSPGTTCVEHSDYGPIPRNVNNLATAGRWISTRPLPLILFMPMDSTGRRFSAVSLFSYRCVNVAYGQELERMVALSLARREGVFVSP